MQKDAKRYLKSRVLDSLPERFFDDLNKRISVKKLLRKYKINLDTWYSWIRNIDNYSRRKNDKVFNRFSEIYKKNYMNFVPKEKYVAYIEKYKEILKKYPKGQNCNKNDGRESIVKELKAENLYCERYYEGCRCAKCSARDHAEKEIIREK